MKPVSLIFRYSNVGKRGRGYYNRRFGLWLCRYHLGVTFGIRARHLRVEMTHIEPKQKGWHRLRLGPAFTCYLHRVDQLAMTSELYEFIAKFLDRVLAEQFWVRFTPINNHKSKQLLTPKKS